MVPDQMRHTPCYQCPCHDGAERGTNFPNAASLGLWSLAWLLARHRPPSCREKNKSGQIKEQVARLGKTCCQEQYTFLPICGARVRTRICEQMYFGVACFLRSIWCSDTFFFFAPSRSAATSCPAFFIDTSAAGPRTSCSVVEF